MDLHRSANIDIIRYTLTRDNNNNNECTMNKIRHNWQKEEVATLFDLPLMDLLYQAQTLHRESFDPNAIQASTLLSIKTGACPEDCGYCSQSGHHNAELKKQKLIDVEAVLEQAKKAKAAGATRFCMGGAWRSPPKKDFPNVLEMVTQVRELGLETCLTAGMLDHEQASQLKEAGLDYYNHNIDTSKEYYDKVITTRTFEDRLNTIENVRNSGINVCCGGILGLGETREDRISMLCTLANFDEHPESVPINQLVPIEGTPLGNSKGVDTFEFIRAIAIARIMMPKSMVRLSAGRSKMSDEMQAMCFFAGANSIFYGDKLLTTDNPDEDSDNVLLAKLGMRTMDLPSSVPAPVE